MAEMNQSTTESLLARRICIIYGVTHAGHYGHYATQPTQAVYVHARVTCRLLSTTTHRKRGALEHAWRASHAETTHLEPCAVRPRGDDLPGNIGGKYGAPPLIAVPPSVGLVNRRAYVT